MGKVLPDYLSEWTTDKVRSEGVTVLPNSRVKAVTKGEKANLSVKMESGATVETDHMVVAVSCVNAEIFGHRDSFIRLVLSPTLLWLLPAILKSTKSTVVSW